jgi:hypothetical protein
MQLAARLARLQRRVATRKPPCAHGPDGPTEIVYGDAPAKVEPCPNCGKPVVLVRRYILSSPEPSDSGPLPAP